MDKNAYKEMIAEYMKKNTNLPLLEFYPPLKTKKSLIRANYTF